MDATAAIWTIIGFILGILASIIAGIRLSFLQFKSSTAGYRVDAVAEATCSFFRFIDYPEANLEMNTGRLRNKFRYSLGVILDELVQKFGRAHEQAGIEKTGPWPVICELDDPTPKVEDNPASKVDRWRRFNEYIRPVINDINVYAFVSRFPHVFDWLYDRKLLNRLGKLTDLCHQLEVVVGELDAAYESKLIYVKDGAIYPNEDRPSPVIVQSMTDLRRAWNEWLKVVLPK